MAVEIDTVKEGARVFGPESITIEDAKEEYSGGR